MSKDNGGNPRLDRVEKILEAMSTRHNAEISRHDREMREIRQDLRRWARLGVQEARNQRKRDKEFDEKITQLAAAHLETEEKLSELADAHKRTEQAQRRTEQALQRFLDWRGNGQNGKTDGKR